MNAGGRAAPRAGATMPRTALLLVAAAGVLACSPATTPPPGELTQVETHVLAARDSNAPDSFVRGGHANTVWRRVAGEPLPVFESQAPFSLVVPLQGGGRLSARGLAGVDSPRGTRGEARFEVSLLCPGAPPRRLSSMTLAGGGASWAPLVVEETPLPVDACEVRIDIAVEPVPFPGRVLLADPVVERRWDLTAPERPRANLLLISADTTRADALGPWGGGARTPHLDRLAGQGIVFEDAHSVAFGTTPSHASLFTGQAAARHGVYDNQTALSPEEETLAEHLRDSGYQTAAFVGATPVARRLGLDQGFLLYDDVFAPDEASGLGEFALHERRADVTVDRFGAWLERRPAAPPFAAWLHFYDPHQPYAPRPPVAGEDPEMTRFFGPPGAPERVRADTDAKDLAAQLDATARRRYEAEIAFVDAQLGRAIAHLQRRGVYEETLILFVTDHGENFLDRGESLAWNHAGLFPEVTRIGVLLRLPGAERGGRRVPGLVANSDLACLVARVLGVEPVEAWSCRGLLPAVQAGSRLPPRELLLEGAHRGEVAVRSERWLLRQAGSEIPDEKLTLDGFVLGARVQMYDLAVDPDSRHDLIPAGAAPLNERARLQELIAEVRRTRVGPEEGLVVGDESHREALRALGYVR